MRSSTNCSIARGWSRSLTKKWRESAKKATAKTASSCWNQRKQKNFESLNQPLNKTTKREAKIELGSPSPD